MAAAVTAAAAAAAVVVVVEVAVGAGMRTVSPTSSNQSIATTISSRSRTPGRGAADVVGEAGMRR